MKSVHTMWSILHLSLIIITILAISSEKSTTGINPGPE